MLTDAAQRKHFHDSMFHGYDFDATMLRIGSMNMLLHGVESPDIRYRDSLVRGRERGRREIHPDPGQPAVRRHPRLRVDLQGPAAGRQDQEDRAAVPGAVPEAAEAGRPCGGHRARRRAVRIVQGAQGPAPHPGRRPEARRRSSSCRRGVFKPYAGVSTAILLFTKTNSGGTDHVWFYDVQADGFSLDDKRNPVEANDLPDVLARWASSAPRSERKRARTEQSFCVPEGRHRRPRLRPLDQPLQGNRSRRGRAPAAAGDHRRHREAGSRDRAGTWRS